MSDPVRMREAPRVPVWLPALVLVIAVGGLIVAITRGNWLSIGSFALLSLTWALLLYSAIRARRSA